MSLYNYRNFCVHLVLYGSDGTHKKLGIKRQGCLQMCMLYFKISIVDSFNILLFVNVEV